MLHRGVPVLSYPAMPLVVKEIGNAKGVPASGVGKPFICYECDREFGTQRGLKIHKCAVVYDDDDDLYACPICSQQFNTVGKLVVHTKGHIAARSQKFVGQTNRFHGANDLKSEITSAGGKPSVHEESWKSTQRSNESCKTELRSYKCGICLICFSTYQGLKRHNRVSTCYTASASPKRCTRSNSEKPKDLTPLVESLKLEVTPAGKENGHDKVVTLPRLSSDNDSQDMQEMQYVCDECGRSFDTNSGLKRHSTRKHWERDSPSIKVEDASKNQVTTSPHECLENSLSVNVDVSKNQMMTSPRTRRKCPESSLSPPDASKSQVATSPRARRKCLEKPSESYASRNRETGPHRCNYCIKSFASKLLLKQHATKIHAKEYIKRVQLTVDIKAEVVTSVQGKCFENPSNLKSQETHVTPFRCDYCSRYLSSKQALQVHLLRIHKEDVEESHQCENCAQSFLTSIALEKHSKTCNRCKICGKNFSRNHKLREHLLSHEGRFKCKECNAMLSSGYSLRRHAMVHTGELPFTCKYCKKGFRASDKLSYHIKSNHKGRRH